MSALRMIVVLALVVFVATIPGCRTVPKPDPIPDQPTPPLSAYWPHRTADPAPQK